MPDEDDAPRVTEAPLAPEDVSERSFPTAFRGFDPVEVRAFLGQVADELRRLQGREIELQRTVDEVDAKPADPASHATDLVANATSEAERLVAGATSEAERLVADAAAEADRLVREARDRVGTLGTAATAEASRVLGEARVEAVKVRAARSEEAESTAVRKIAEAEREAASIRVKAREDAEVTIEAAKQRGREMVAEAQAARERMLADLAKRKRAAQSQLEQLKAGRDRLLDTLRVAKRSIDEMTSRFEVQESGMTAPHGGTVSPPVTTTPGMPAVEARPRPASLAASPPGDSGERVRVPSRSRSVTIGEGPGAGRPHVGAPQMRSSEQTVSGETPPAAAGSDARPAAASAPVDAPTAASKPAAAPAHEAGDITPTPQPPRAEERRSSALRILRRHRGADRNPPQKPPPVGRESSGEGIRIIGRLGSGRESDPLPASVDSREQDDAAADWPARALDEAVETPPVAPPDTQAQAVDVSVDQQAGDTLPEDMGRDVPAAVVDEVDPLPELVSPGDADIGELPEPMARDEIRPRIEDLFARMRADREAAVTTAREVLAAATDAGVKQSPDPTVDEGAAVSASASDRATTPRADDAPGPRANAASRAKATSATRALDSVAPATRVTSNDDERRLQARDAVTEALTGQLTRRLKRALQDEQNESLDRLRTSRRPAAIGAVLNARDDQATPYRELAIPFLDEAARAGASGSKYGPVSVGVDDLAAALAGDLASALRGRLEQALTSGGSEDPDLGAISERISSVYREWKGQKVERLAVHYLVAAHERGCFLSHPEGTLLRWIVDDEGPCPDCEDNGLAGPTPRGEPFPTGQLHPPAHMGCRCLLTPTSS